VDLKEGEGLSGDQITIVWLDNFGEQRNRSGDGLCAQKSENTKHGQSSVVDFNDKTLGLISIASVLAPVQGIVKVQWNRVGDGGTELGEGTRLSSLHIVGLVDVGVCDARGKLAVNLQESDDGDDLVLGFDGKGRPLFRRGQVGAGEGGSIKFHGPREVKVGLNTVTNKGGHGNTSVLDLSMSEESNGSFISLFPKVPGCETKRIIVVDFRVQVGGEGLKVRLRRLQLCGGGRGARGGERGSGCGGRKDDSSGGLHGEIFGV